MSGISGIKTAFSEKCSDSSFMRKVLQKPRNDATNATGKTVETGKTASNPAEETSFDNSQPVETGKTCVDKTGLTKQDADKTGCQNWQADKTDAVEADKVDLEEDGFIYTDEANWESLYEHMPPQAE